MKRLSFLPLFAVGFLAACGDSNNSSDGMSSSSENMTSSSGGSSSSEMQEVMAYYDITLINASAAQTLSPAAVVLTEAELSWWQVGIPASYALESLAESGSPAMLLSDTVALDSQETGATPAAMSTQITLMHTAGEPTMLSLAAMPIYTNDAFVGVQNLALQDMAVGETITVNAAIYDAGTEANDEDMATVPGLGGEASNSARDDIRDQVTLHPGIVSEAALWSSDIAEEFRFDSHSFVVKVTRTQ